jgi:hypothetical protein
VTSITISSTARAMMNTFNGHSGSPPDPVSRSCHANVVT